jgi:hypothetical protein
MVITIMAEIGNHAGNEPWPSLEIASWLFDRASFVLIGSLICGTLATVIIVWMGIVKEHHWDLAREQAQERIAILNKETARLSADAEASRAAIAGANARALEAQLALEKFKAPRTFTPEQQQRITSKVIQFTGQEWAASVSSVPDALSFLMSLDAALKDAGWIRVPPLGDVTIADGQVSIALFEKPGIRVQVAPDRESDLGLVARVLAAAMQSEGIAAEAATSVEVEKRPTAIQIMIGYKPP